MEKAACTALSNSLNYAVALGHIPVKDFLCGVNKVIGCLPEETVEDIQQQTVTVLKGYSQPKDNPTGAECRALQSLEANDLLAVLLAHRGNAAMVLGTSDYNQKINTLLQDKAYTELKKDPKESLVCKTALHLKKSSFAEEVCLQVRPQSSRPRRL
jgi:hypothetical protein